MARRQIIAGAVRRDMGLSAMRPIPPACIASGPSAALRLCRPAGCDCAGGHPAIPPEAVGHMIETLDPLVGHIGDCRVLQNSKAGHSPAGVCRFRACHDLDGAQCAHAASSR